MRRFRPHFALAVLACLLFGAGSACAAGPAAMIFGSDAVSTPDTVSLPTSHDYWFTQGNGTSTNGTQVPSYWVNKVGGELDSLIEFCGALNMSAYNQSLGCIQSIVSTETSRAEGAETTLGNDIQAIPLISGTSPNGSGYIQLPNGLLIQWASVTLTVTTAGITTTDTFNFPRTFITNPFSMMVSYFGQNPQAGTALGAQAINDTQYTVSVANAAVGSFRVNVWAIGQ